MGLVVSVGLVGRSGWLLCLTCLGSAGLRPSLAGPAPEPELAAWPKVAAYRASPGSTSVVNHNLTGCLRVIKG